MLLSDKWIAEQCNASKPLIEPFISESKSQLLVSTGRGAFKFINVASWGLSSYGYDLSLGNKFKLLKNPAAASKGAFIDPNNFDQNLFIDVTVEDGGVMIVPPRGFVLGVVREHLNMPDDVMGVCMEKSTIARSAMEVCVTPVEAGWSGYLTLEIHNKSDFPLHLTPGMGITQIMFYKGEQPCRVPYHARAGKYQNQPAEPVAPRAKTSTIVVNLPSNGNVGGGAGGSDGGGAGGSNAGTCASISLNANTAPWLTYPEPTPPVADPVPAEKYLEAANALEQAVKSPWQDIMDKNPNRVAGDPDDPTVMYYMSPKAEELIAKLTVELPQYTHLTYAQWLLYKATGELPTTKQLDPAPSAMEQLRKALHDDPEYAWAWYSNLAMPIADYLPSEMAMVDRYHSGRYAAACLMQYLFGINIGKNPIATNENVPTSPSNLATTLTAHAGLHRKPSTQG